MTLGDVIYRYRTEHGLSMEQFSKKSGLSKAYVALLEKNEHPKTKQPITPSVVTFGCVANVLGISLDALMEMVDENQPVYVVAKADPPKGHGMRVRERCKPIQSDKGTRLNCNIDSALYNTLAALADDNDQTLEDEIEERLWLSVQDELDRQGQKDS